MYIKCEHPQIIIHPYSRDNILKYGNYYIRGHRYDVSSYKRSYVYCEGFNFDISPRKLKITQDEIDDCYVVDDTGVIHPLYLCVPCGKCVLCTEKRKNDWVARAVCEAQTSISEPLWIGLSYNDENLPEHGVNKDDVQKFMKRLRIRLTRDGYEHDLRYFIASEYGSDYQRAHYHMLLYNFPVMDDELKKIYIDKAWSKVVSKEVYENSRKVVRFPVFKYRKKYENDVRAKSIVKNLLKQSNGIITPRIAEFVCNVRYHVRLGFVDFKLAIDEKGISRIPYCMKYIHKDDKIPKEIIGKYNYSPIVHRLNIDPIFCDVFGRFGREKKRKIRLCRYTQNKPFFLSSRKSALGKEWLLSKFGEYEKNVCLNDVVINDRWSGKSFKFSLPMYFKSILYPSLSRMVKKEVRDTFKEFNKLLYHRSRITTYQNGVVSMLDLTESHIIEKFKALPYYSDYKFNKYYQFENEKFDYYNDLVNVNKQLNKVKSYLLDVEIDSDYIIRQQNKKALFTQFIIDRARCQTEIPIPDLVNRIKKRRQRAKEREKFLLVHREI